MKRTNHLPRPVSIATKAIHGTRMYPHRGPVSFPIYQTSTFRFETSEDAIRHAEGDESVYVYTRYHNPTTQDVEEKLALMEDGEAAAIFSSGMAAITTAILTAVKSGEELVSTPSLYGGTYRFFRDVLPNHQICVRYVDPDHLEELESLITKKTRLVYFETPTNPTLNLIDIEQLVRLTQMMRKRLGIPLLTMIDNTFATTLNQCPFDFGVDAVVESATKYLGGHSDIIAGVVVGRRDFTKRVKTSAKYYGGCADPFASYLLLRSLKTFELRVERQNENALALAGFFEKHPKVKHVLYPGLPSHPKHQLARKQMRNGFGGIVTIELKGGVKAAVKVCNRLRIAINAMSLGGVETLVSIPVYSSHVKMTPDELQRHGVTPGMLRISVGVEAVEDLMADFEEALRFV
ncbi:MAG: aminotransferase class I/II-fold pyridoxal phosphate-dependent enzyme [Bacteroidota bacterium]